MEAALAVGLLAHFKIEGTAAQQHIVRDIESLVGLAVDQQSLHIAATVAHTLGPHLYGSAVGQGQPQVGQIGRAQHVLVRARTDGIEAEGREDVPGGHLAAIVVAT